MRDRITPLNIGDDYVQAAQADLRVSRSACREMTIERYCHAGRWNPERDLAIALN